MDVWRRERKRHKDNRKREGGRWVGERVKKGRGREREREREREKKKKKKKKKKGRGGEGEGSVLPLELLTYTGIFFSLLSHTIVIKANSSAFLYSVTQEGAMVTLHHTSLTLCSLSSFTMPYTLWRSTVPI